ncbi:MAG TPA: DNA methyltransferase [Thermoleophilaceae bacterium]|nr:DNA methyltransferase [Thermoleophilaceae bacterium]
MALTGEEIRARLAAFAARWSVYEGTERGEAQTFLNELFACYGRERFDVAALEDPTAGGFMDLFWPDVCIIEMKAPSEARRLNRHRAQVLDYWRRSADAASGRAAPPYVVLCAFRRLEIWEPGRFPDGPRVELDLIDLPEQYEVLLFLAGSEPVFLGGQTAVTRDAVASVTELFHRLSERRAADRDVLRDFVLQAIWCMFAEDLGQIPEHRFTRLIDGLRSDKRRSSADDLGLMFERLDDATADRSHGLYAGVPYANGGLFERPAHVHLEPEEIDLLRLACGFNWREVQPQIFGSLLEGALGHEQQWQLGAHYTHEADIQKVVQPSIVRPWSERIDALTTPADAAAAREDLMRYVVLDPACGSGNFLYVAYRELRRIEDRLRRREADLRRDAGMQEQGTIDFYPLQNICGIELNSFAVALARVTLWMGHKLAVDELGLAERTLPLEDLSGLRAGDALRLEWPRADVIIGNPPFHGSQNLRRELGDEYVEWLSREFRVGIKDYCVYWFRLAHDRLADGDRAGLVGTNSVSQNRARGVSLDYIADNGGVITDAVSKQPWPGQAVVNVSIVNWVKQPESPPGRFLLDGEEVSGISPSLREAGSLEPVRLAANRGRSFQGPIPAGDFYLTAEEAEGLLARDDAPYADVVRPYLIGDDIAEDPAQGPRRWIVDFDRRSLEDAMRYPAALDLVRQRVKPERDRNRDPGFRERWWQFGRSRGAMRAAVEPLTRFICGNRIGKRFLYVWVDAATCPSDLTIVFAFDDDYSMGILLSSVHCEWARRRSSTLEDRPRYTPTTAFETFPWPDATQAARDEIAGLARAIVARRSEVCRDRDIGLTDLYNAVDEGAYADLRDLHASLDIAVAHAYGWPASVVADLDEVCRRLTALNAEIAAGERSYVPFASA